VFVPVGFAFRDMRYHHDAGFARSGWSFKSGNSCEGRRRSLCRPSATG
jgi:hypothetical protein